MADRARFVSVVALSVLALVLTSCTDGATGSGRPADTSASGSGHPAITPTAGAGTVVTRAIPGGDTGFEPRPALVYLPPAARTNPHERFPVLLLLSGTPGSPTNWTMLGKARTTLDRFAAAHGGRSPVVVMPDINGSVNADTECIRTTRGGNVERYLADVVPAWIGAHLPVTSDRRGWGIAGASEGGTCALMLGLRDYPGWGFVGDISGLRRPTVGDTDNPPATIAQLFMGSRTAYEAHDPSLLLRRRRYPRLSLWFECGVADTAVVADQRAVAALGRRSVREVRAGTIAGGHGWRVFSSAFASALPAFWAQAARSG